MLEKEIIEKKIVNAKEDGENFQHYLSPEESKAVYLKKLDGAQQGAEQHLGTLSIHDGDGNVVASSDYGGDVKQKFDPTVADGQSTNSEDARQEAPEDGPYVSDIHASADDSGRINAGRIARYMVDPLAPLGDAVEWFINSASDQTSHSD